MIFFNLKMFCFSFQCQFFSFYMSGDDLESSIMISAPNVVFHLKEEERKKERERERKKKERKRERERERKEAEIEKFYRLKCNNRRFRTNQITPSAK